MTYSELIGRVVSDMASFPPPVLAKAMLRQAARDFCDITHALRIDYDKDAVAATRTYEVFPSGDLHVKQVCRVFLRSAANVANEEDGSECPQTAYDVVEQDAASVSAVVVTCSALGMDGEAFADAGELLNSLPVLSNADSSYYLFCGFNTESGVGAIYYLATAAQYVLAQSGALPSSGYYLPGPFDDLYGTYEAVASEAGSGTATVARTAASGVSFAVRFVKGREPTVSVSDGLRIRCVMVPGFYSDDLPDWFMARYGQGLVAGARAKLLGMPNRPWSDREMAGVEATRFRGFVADAKWDCVTQKKSVQLVAGGGFII